jgi:hypothetical protein
MGLLLSKNACRRWSKHCRERSISFTVSGQFKVAAYTGSSVWRSVKRSRFHDRTARGRTGDYEDERTSAAKYQGYRGCGRGFARDGVTRCSDKPRTSSADSVPLSSRTEDRLCCVLNLTFAQQRAGGTSSGPGFILGAAHRSRRRGGTSPDPLRISSQGTM